MTWRGSSRRWMRMGSVKRWSRSGPLGTIGRPDLVRAAREEPIVLVAGAVDLAEPARAGAHRVFDLLARPLRGALEALGIAGDDLGMGLEQLEHALGAVQHRGDALPVPREGVLPKLLERFARIHRCEHAAGRVERGRLQ